MATGTFHMNFDLFAEIVTAYLEQLQTPTVESLWQKIGGDKKGFITTDELHQMFDKCMPRCFDRNIAFELFREIDADRDGRLTYKDFAECIKF